MTESDDMRLRVSCDATASGTARASAEMTSSRHGLSMTVASAGRTGHEAELLLRDALRQGVAEMTRCVDARWGREPLGTALPSDPPAALLWSIAMRHDHAIGMGAEMYDAQVGHVPGDHAKALARLMADARRAYEEVRSFDFGAPRD